jgi:uncharacterized membrane protein SirB2
VDRPTGVEVSLSVLSLEVYMKSRVHIVSYYWLPVVLYMGLIFIQSAHPVPETVPEWPLKDKFLHLAAYSILGALFLRALNQTQWRHRRGLMMVVSVLLTGLYGVSDEWHQYHVPSRSAELADVVADVAGGICGVWAYERLSGKFSAIRRL